MGGFPQDEEQESRGEEGDEEQFGHFVTKSAPTSGQNTNSGAWFGRDSGGRH
ncbi:hypothetical protein PM082_004709 [Marasmius tenuissimus]|nr:hypothetical protein PM082_004709 [Marasmius tenuissimus]